MSLDCILELEGDSPDWRACILAAQLVGVTSLMKTGERLDDAAFRDSKDHSRSFGVRSEVSSPLWNASMLLKIVIGKNLRTENLLTHACIPWVCSIGREFEVELNPPFDAATGTVEGWSSKEIALRAPAGAGGALTHYAHGRITLRPASEDTYEVVDLDMFYPMFGWLPVVAGGLYATPFPGLDDEEEESQTHGTPARES